MATMDIVCETAIMLCLTILAAFVLDAEWKGELYDEDDLDAEDC